jgi:DNA-binding MarR family transcriptional regulator
MPKPDDSSRARTAACTCSRLRKVTRRVSQIYDRSLEASGLTVTQYALLAHLVSFDGISIGALAEKMVMDPTSLTRTLRPLERQGLVALKPSRSDRRMRSLHLTAAGRRAFDEAKPAWARTQRFIESAIGELETPALHAALDRVLERLADWDEPFARSNRMAPR